MCTVDNKDPQSNPFTQRIAKNKVPPPGGRWWRQPPKGVHFRRPQGGCMVLYKLAPERAPYLASAAILYTSRGRSPQPVREASAGPGQNPWRPGPSGPAAPSTLTPVRACQPTGILESTAPHRSRSRSRPRRRRLNPHAQRGLSPAHIPAVPLFYSIFHTYTQ